MAGPAARTTPSGDRPPAVLAGAVAAATVCALVLLYYSGPAANLSGFLVGAVGGPLLLVGFLVALERRQAGGRFGDWRWLGSRQAMSALALAGFAAGAAHIWFYAKEVTRWLAG